MMLTDKLKSLPWRKGDAEAGEAPIMGADGKPVVSRVRGEPRRPDSEFAAHLDLVVRAVNCHDDLLAACKEALAVFTGNEYGGAPGTSDARVLLMRALAKAQPQES